MIVYPSTLIPLQNYYEEANISPQDICWYDSSKQFQINNKRIEQEKIEQDVARAYQIKKGIIKMQEPDHHQVRVTQPILTKLKGHELFKLCPCGNKEMLKDCTDCLKRLKIIKG